MGWNIFDLFKAESEDLQSTPASPTFAEESVERIERTNKRLTISPIAPPTQAKSTSTHKKLKSAKQTRIVSGPMGIKR
ncbi:MAG: hypothetical protein KDD66_04875 [Bdellovibrionales bacterium]|nr:hypothetical protein [Bdellovibrionales bacterium]